MSRPYTHKFSHTQIDSRMKIKLDTHSKKKLKEIKGNQKRKRRVQRRKSKSFSKKVKKKENKRYINEDVEFWLRITVHIYNM